jgi:hypothetical protein
MSMRAALAGSLIGLSSLTMPAAAGDTIAVVVYEAPRPAWYHQEPWIGTGPGYYYSQHPDHIPAYPAPLSGYAVPIYSTPERVVRVAPRVGYGVVRHGGSHAHWCSQRYRSYDWRSDTFQPHHGPRRACHSPWR